MAVMVPGLVLAAGASSRMRRDKALLTCGPGSLTFVASIIEALRDGGVDDVLVIGRPEDDALREEVDAYRARFVENPRHQDGQLSSLLAGLNVADRPGVQAVLTTPVDLPLIDGRIVATLLEAWSASRDAIVRPVYRGRHGHPVIFPRAVFADLRHADPSIGARGVVNAHAAHVVDVDIDDSAVVTDIDTPEDYDRLIRTR